jgi:hypothetical protein
VSEANSRIQVMQPSDGSDAPTIGAIKRALHELSRTTGSAQRNSGAILREAHALLMGLARRNGIDPDIAVNKRLAAVESQRRRMVLVSPAPSDQTSS